MFDRLYRVKISKSCLVDLWWRTITIKAPYGANIKENEGDVNVDVLNPRWQPSKSWEG